MKKLAYLVSAVAAAFTGAAHADVSVSGSADVGYVNNYNGEGIISVGSVTSFALSTTTANGVGISVGQSLSVDQDANNANASSGGQAVTFTTSGATIVVGDVELGDTPGSIGGVVGNLVGDVNGFDTDVDTGFGDDDGTGVTFSTAVGGMTVGFGYIVNDSGDNQGNIDASGAQTMSAFNIAVPMGDYTVTAGVANHDSGESASGATIAAAMGGGTLKLGYSQQSLKASDVYDTGSDLATDGDSTVLGATYSMSLDADTTVAVGYKSAKDADSHSTTQTDLSISRSLGGGASVYLDMRNLQGDVDSSKSGSAVGFGTSVSF
jgi:outer membrane protein OmpU